MRMGYREFGRSVKINLLNRQTGIFSDPNYTFDTWKYSYKDIKFNGQLFDEFTTQRFDGSTCELWNKFIKR